MSDYDAPMTFDPANLPLRAVQDERRNAIGTDGPEFEIKSGSFGGAWNNKRGDLASPFFTPCD